MTLNFFLAVIVTSLGSGFQHGFNVAILNVPAEAIQNWMTSNRSQEYLCKKHMRIIWSSTVAVFAIGGIFGGFLIGIFTNQFGRKGSLLFNNIIILGATTIQVCSKTFQSYKLLLLGRFLTGINAGLNSGLCPMYLVEIAPDDIRGAVGSTYHLFVAFGMLLSQIAGYFLGTDDNWPYIFLISIAPALFQLILLPICPESPKYLLITQGKDKKAEKALQWLRGKQNVREELELLKEEDSLVKNLRDSSLKRILRIRPMKNALLCCLAFHIAQQTCGINMVYLVIRNRFFLNIILRPYFI